VFQSGSFINASLILAAKRPVRPSIPSSLTLVARFSVSSRQVSSSNIAHFLPNIHTRAHIHISQTRFADSSAFFANVFLPRLLLFPFRSTPTVKEYPLPLPSPIPRVAYIPISISIIAEELPASLGASQGCGLQMVFRRYFRFPLLSVRDAYLDVSSSGTISRYLSIDISLLLSFSLSLSIYLSLFLSLPFSPPLFYLLLLVLSYSDSFLASRFVCTHTLDPQQPLDCEFPRWKRKMSGPCWGNKWTWSCNWFSCPAGKGFSLHLPNHPIVCRVCRDSWQSELDISCIDWGCFNLIGYWYLLLIRQNKDRS